MKTVVAPDSCKGPLSADGDAPAGLGSIRMPAIKYFEVSTGRTPSTGELPHIAPAPRLGVAPPVRGQLVAPYGK